MSDVHPPRMSGTVPMLAPINTDVHELRTPTPSSSTARPHSASISSVHFQDTALSRLSGPLTPEIPNGHASRPIIKARSSSPMRSPSSPAREQGMSPRVGYSSRNARSPLIVSGMDIPQPRLPTASSQDRRVRSEGGAMVRPDSLAHGKRASVLTGGYETSSDGTSSDETDDLHESQVRPQSRPMGLGSRSHSNKGRKRAKTIAAPTSEETSSSRPQARQRPSQQISFSRSEYVLNSSNAQAGPSRQTHSKLRDVQRADGDSSPESRRKGKQRQVDSFSASLGLGVQSNDLALTSGRCLRRAW